MRAPRKTAKAKRPARRRAAFPIVGIGASAGGLAPIGELLDALPADPGAAFVIISHMDPGHQSVLDVLLAKKTRMPVQKATNGTAIEPNHVYVIQPDKDVTLERGVLHTTARSKHGSVPTVIDRFFGSLAQDQGTNARGVVLSGIGSDGTLGLELIREHSGITFAQNPRTAQFDSMPVSAIQADCVDFVLAPREIARRVLHPARKTKRTTASVERSLSGQPRDHLDDILATLFQSSGVDFSQYKLTTLRRRIARRMGQKRLDSLAAYSKYLRTHPDEVQALYKESLIHVSGFFRDPEAFRALEHRVLAPLAKSSRAVEPIRVWVPGCASGEEVYSIGMLLLERLGERANRRRIQLFGTDISAPDIDAARTGRFSPDALAGVSPARRKRFFVKVRDEYHVRPELRELCVFACHDVGSDPPFSKLDLVSCRNLLIYFAGPLQDRVIETFHYALKPDGALFLGKSESLSRHARLFALADKKHRIYQRRPAQVRPVMRSTLPSLRVVVPDAARIAPPAASPASAPRAELREKIDRLLLERYAPPGIYVDRNLQILSFQGDVSPYLRPSSGQADLHLGKMVPPELALDIRAAITAASKSRRSVHREGVLVVADDRSRTVKLVVIPFSAADRLTPGHLVLFETAAQAPGAPPSGKPASRRERGELARLNKLLESTREQLQTVIDEQESSVQELTTAQEELLSSNEELQSSNEELETAKEELQSGNEELTTVNEELRRRNEELDRLTGELSNLIAGVEIPIVSLDRDRTVLRFSPAAKTSFNLIDADIGHSFDRIKAPLAEPNLDALIAQALQRGVAIEREVPDKSGRWQLLRVRPYKTSEKRIEGILITLVDIDRIKRRAAAIIETIQEPLLVLDAQSRVLTVNAAFSRTFHVTAAQAEGTLLFKLGNKEWNIPELHTLIDEVLPRHKHFEGFRVEYESAQTGKRVFLLSGQQIFDEGVGTNTVLIVFLDVTEREVAAMQLRALTHRLREEKEQAEKRLAHELHDLSSRGFASLSIDLARLAKQVSSAPGEVEQELRALGARVGALASSTHDIARRVHPSVLDDLGLPKALEAECRAFAEHTGMTVKFQAAASAGRKLSEPVTLCLYRVAQEALRNVAAHAQATHVNLTLSRTRARVGMTVHDDGIGFDSDATRAAGGLGLVSIAERVAAVSGNVSISSKLTAGTTVKVNIPIHGDGKAG